MPWGLLFLPLLGGYYFLHRFYPTKYRAQALSHYRLLFESGLVGLGSLVAARFLVLPVLATGTASEFVRWWKTDFFPLPYSGTCSLSFILCFLTATLVNLVLSRTRASEKAYEDYADELTRLIIRAQRGTRAGPLPLLITLKNRKVYIGIVHAAPTPEQARPYLGLLPIVSGVRDPDTLQVSLTTYYDQAYEILDESETGEDWDLEDFTVVIPFEEIASATTFVESLSFADFERQEDSATSEEPVESLD